VRIDALAKGLGVTRDRDAALELAIEHLLR
jgi:hypothetical protein